MQTHQRHPTLRTVRFNGRLSSRTIALQRYRWRDTAPLHRRFRPELFQSANRRDQRPPANLPAFWLWLHRTFQWFYSIITPASDGGRIVGFIGLYGLTDSRGVTLSMAIFNPADRRRGYGRRALALLLDDLERRAVVDAVRVRIVHENRASAAFFRRMGFAPRPAEDDDLVLYRRCLGACRRPAAPDEIA